MVTLIAHYFMLVKLIFLVVRQMLNVTFLKDLEISLNIEVFGSDTTFFSSLIVAEGCRTLFCDTSIEIKKFHCNACPLN